MKWQTPRQAVYCKKHGYIYGVHIALLTKREKCIKCFRANGTSSRGPR